jgi:ABC-type polysaccharide/polyol phosphate export permease
LSHGLALAQMVCQRRTTPWRTIMSTRASAARCRVYGARAAPGPAARRDVLTALLDWRLWTSLGWLDVKQRYRRSFLGPFWITISMVVLVVALGTLYAGIFRQEVGRFLPFLGAGFIVWSFVSTTIGESTAVFVAAEGMIKHGGIPLSLHVFRMIWRNAIVAAHNLTVMLLIYAWQPGLVTPSLLLLVPGIALIVANLGWITIVIGGACTRYRDLPPIVANVLQILLFLSPIMYDRSVLPPGMEAFVDLNPMSYVIDAVRGPLIGQPPSAMVFLALAAFAVVGWMFALRFLSRARARIPYWV